MWGHTFSVLSGEVGKAFYSPGQWMSAGGINLPFFVAECLSCLNFSLYASMFVCVSDVSVCVHIGAAVCVHICGH